MSGNKDARCLGLIGGLGVGATVYYYESRVEAHALRGLLPHLLINHADVDRVLSFAAAGKTRSLAEYLAGLIGQLARAGAEVAAIPAMTAHICIDDLVELSPIPVVSLLDVIHREIQVRRLNRVAIFGTRVTIETAMFGIFDGLSDVEAITP